MICFFFLFSCEKTSLQNTSREVSENTRVSQRQITDCDDCDDDCCCGIELVSAMGTTNFRICGVSSETGTCGPVTPPSPCSSISGGGTAFTLSSGSPKFGFCMLLGNSFYIQNLSSLDVAVYITCQYDVVFSQRIQITIPANGGIVYIDTFGNCQVVSC